MNRRNLTISLVVTLVVGLTALFVWFSGPGGALAQGPDVSIATAAVNSRINYQGILKEDGSPVTGNRNLTFRFYTDGTCTTQMGSDIAMSGVSVTDGLFSVRLEVDQSLFNGQGLWLGVDVGGTGTNTSCEEIVPVPYALSLRPGAIISGSLPGPLLILTNTYTVSTSILSPLGGRIYAEGIEVKTNSGYAIFGRSEEEAGVIGHSKTSAGVEGWSTNGVGGDFYSQNDYGIHVESEAGKAALFVGDVELQGEVYAQSLHVTDTGMADGRPVVNITNDGKLEVINDNGKVSLSGYETGLSNAQGNMTGYWFSANGNFWTQGNLTADGTKNAVVSTDSYGQRKLYADESAEVYFFDRGQGQLVNGAATITLDLVFLETVTIDEEHRLLVQVTLTGDCNGVFVAEKTATGFTVQELMGGASNATFDWEVAAKRRGYEDVRMEPFISP